MPSAPISRSPSAGACSANRSKTRSPLAENPVASCPVATESPTVSSSAPCSAGRSAITNRPPRADTSGTSARFRTRPSIRRISNRARVGANPRAMTVSATPSAASAAMALGASPRPKPSSRGDVVRSKMRTVQPDCRRAMPADNPPMPAPTISAVRDMPLLSDGFEVRYPPGTCDHRSARHHETYAAVCRRSRQRMLRCIEPSSR